jgi:hypothetical protein
VEKADVKRRLEILRYIRDYNIKIDLKERDERTWTELISFKTDKSL